MCCSSTWCGRRSSRRQAGLPRSTASGRRSASSSQSAVAANRWNGALYALPWFVDVGMLYWRTDLMPAPPDTLSQLVAAAQDARTRHGLPFGLVWQGARYEGLVTVFVEHLGAFGGAILDGDGRVVVDAGPAVRALTFMRDAIHRDAVVPARGAHLAGGTDPLRLPERPGGVHAQLAVCVRAHGRRGVGRRRPTSPWRRCRARRAARPRPRSGARRWPSTRSAISPTTPIA